MFYIVFGLIWMAICGFIIYGFYDPSQAGEIIVNNEVVTYEEFSQMLWPKLLLGFVMLIGLIVFLAGVYMIFKDYRTKKYGKKTIGIVTKVEPNGQTINEQLVYDVSVLVLEDNNICKTYKENIGTSPYNYSIGGFYEVQYFKNDVNIISKIDEIKIPIEKLQLMQREFYALQK